MFQVSLDKVVVYRFLLNFRIIIKCGSTIGIGIEIAHLFYKALRYSGLRFTSPARALSIRFSVFSFSLGKIALIGR